MDTLSVAQALAGSGVDQRGCIDGMGNVEMFPSSAVAQSHVPGSAAHIGTLQQPPTPNLLSQHHQRASSIFQNPSFDNKHSAYRSAEASVSVNLVKNSDYSQQQQQQQHSTEMQSVQHSNPTMTSTNTATSTAMMVDEAVPPPVSKTNASTQATNDTINDKATTDNAKAAETNADDAGSSSAVRKVRTWDRTGASEQKQ
ncbi:uncharacterized protein UTRI_02822_B [Ustilago trichophora]|uniref:Uncharacterized protein n=1 Tax=Ustilago trichophora TaxID=86804 RepID=A0A5C3E4Q8_9BASI|nr:uncharacterized protein UTRI_02822_B [Ustilago trichophora]